VVAQQPACCFPHAPTSDLEATSGVLTLGPTTSTHQLSGHGSETAPLPIEHTLTTSLLIRAQCALWYLPCPVVVQQPACCLPHTPVCCRARRVGVTGQRCGQATQVRQQVMDVMRACRQHTGQVTCHPMFAAHRSLDGNRLETCAQIYDSKTPGPYHTLCASQVVPNDSQVYSGRYPHGLGHQYFNRAHP
jgi:hypothetical protein